MFDKLLFNNQLLANKKNVQKAKTICINKLIHKIKKLKILKVKKSEDTKIDVKINKLIDEIKHIKRLKSIDILKKAVLNEENPSRVITNGLALPEEVAEASLFSQKIILNIVQNLRELFQLNSSNPNWRESLQELSKKQKKMARIKNIQEKIDNRKIHKELKQKRNEWLEENLPKDLKLNSSLLESNDSSTKENSIINGKIDFCKETTMKKRNNDKANERSISNYGNIKNDAKLQIDDDELDTVKTVDPFFVTASGENYLSTVIIDRVQPEQPENGTVRRDRRATQQKFAQNTNLRHKNKKTFKINPLKIKEKTKISAFSSKSLNSKVVNYNIESKKNDVHPSWAAKEKQKGIKEFSGKKITFNDDNLDTKCTKSILSQKQSIKLSIGEESNGILHPSWSAKQKLKPIISKFEGTKIKFDDNE